MIFSLNSLNILLHSQAGMGSYSYNFALTGASAEYDIETIDRDREVDLFLSHIITPPTLSINGVVYKSRLNEKFMSVPYRSSLMGKEGCPLFVAFMERISHGYPHSAMAFTIWPDEIAFEDTLNILGIELVIHVGKLELVVHQSEATPIQAIFTLKIFFRLLHYINNILGLERGPGRVRHHIGSLIK